MMIAGHATSISLEAVFWEALRRAADREGLPVSALVARIDARRIEQEDPANLASAIRIWLFERKDWQSTGGEERMAEISDLERLVALEDIRTLKARRIRALDGQDWATYEALHAPDHVSDNEGEQKWVGAKANTARLAKLHAEMGITTVHHVHTPEITLLSPTSAKGIWAMEDNLYWKQGDEEHWLRGFGFYHETYEKRDGQWLFTSRRLKRIKVLLSPGAVIGEYREPREKAEATA